MTLCSQLLSKTKFLSSGYYIKEEKLGLNKKNVSEVIGKKFMLPDRFKLHLNVDVIKR